MKTHTVNTENEIDLLHLIRILTQKIWVIVICMVVCGALLFTYSALLITPKYQSRAMMYVNNSSLSFGGTSLTISASELSAAKSLLDIYLIILSSRTTLEDVIEEADLNYDYETLSGMVSASSVNGTEVFEIVAVSSDPEEAQLIVETITKILPDRISEIVDGSSVRIVDTAIVPHEKSSPNNMRNGVIGALLGAVICCVVIIVTDLMNTTVRDEEYLTGRYNIPILAVIPDMYAKTSSRRNYYYSNYYQSKSNMDKEKHSAES